MSRPTPTTVDEYLGQIPHEPFRAELERVRALIRSTAPEMEETISYGIPTYKSNGMVIGFAAFIRHVSLFPGHTVADFADQLVGFKTSKGTVQFTPERPVPDAVIVAMVRARIAENAARRGG